MTIQDKVVIVTGASMGIGKATAELFAKNGATVVLAARSKDALESLAKKLPGSVPIVTDMTDPQSVSGLIETARAKLGRIDILVNNAGQGIYGAVENVDVDAYRKIFELNVIGPLRAMQAVIPLMRSQGGGMILNISSMVSKNYFPYLGVYASTKYALNCLSLTARQELAADGITVAVMHPGMTDTDFGKNAVKSDAVAREMGPRRRDGMPEPDSPEYIAERILEAVRTENAETYAHPEAEAKS